ncbi:MAG: redox-regulated ATPase YchF [Candidatus Methanomethyliaceae archaeon]|nr:redox-regulated ATPase YchF [Candidatus Methanomethyliaceae archaeon]MDW7970706.1 redox-regulated ATPase YchF [Nitrososphaerota archaeon]
MISGIIGKTNVGKSTFFSALTLLSVKISNVPFTTIEPNKGVTNIRVRCVCRDFSVKDNPMNSLCINGIRWVPIEIIDVAGLVPGAHKGKGLGNKFLDDLRQVDGFIHVVDAAGSTDISGNPCEIGKGDPVEDIKFVENEITMWIFQILKKDWDKLVKRVLQVKEDPVSVLYERLAGLMIDKKFITSVLKGDAIFEKNLDKWSDQDILEFVNRLRRISKPMVIAANKIDIPKAEENIERLRNTFKEYSIIPCSAEAELLLRLAAKKGIINYMPGDSTFEIIRGEALTDKQRNALMKVRDVLMSWGSTGVQQAIETLYRKELKMIAVFPVENATKLTDHKGNVLPDVILLQEGSTAIDLAYKIHSDLGKNFIFAINVKTGQRIGENYILKDGDVIKIVAGK